MTTRSPSLDAAPALSPEAQEYRRRTPASERFFHEASSYLPGGDSRSTLFYSPYPATFVRGDGSRLVDLDGNVLLDFTGNHSALPHGYHRPEVLDAARRQLELGTAFPGPTEPQLRLARLLVERLPSVERVRFTNSGTEATLHAVRAARVFTGRRALAVAEGGYHGSLEQTSPSAPDVLRLPFNDPAAAAELIDSRGGHLAAVLMEPVQGAAGMIPATQEYLRALREVTRRHGIVLVLDEVVSLRIAWGGAQEWSGVAGDLTVLGKLIGGGFPLGAFGGRADIMALFDPTHGPPVIPHPGSYNANPMSLAAGAAALELLTPAAIARINGLGEQLRRRLAETLSRAGVAAQVTGCGSLFAIHATSQPVRSPRDAATADSVLRHRIFLGLYNAGMLIDPRGVGSISTAIREDDVDRFVAAVEQVVARMRG